MTVVLQLGWISPTSNNAVQLSGIAAEAEWKQPHAIVHVDVEGEAATGNPSAHQAARRYSEGLVIALLMG